MEVLNCLCCLTNHGNLTKKKIKGEIDELC
jgi:hypothetical protein